MMAITKTTLAKAMVAAAAVAALMFGASGGASLSLANSYHAAPPYAGDCTQRPAGTVCVAYDDGYIRLVRDSVTGWQTHGRIQVAFGTHHDYYHVLHTDLVMTLPH